MVSAFAIRTQVETTLARRVPSALTPQPRIVRPVVSTGVAAVDDAIGGGLPVGAVTELVGAECSGRTSLALAFVAQVMREGKVCAWVDVGDALSPESAAAAGMDLDRLLWVRCGVVQAGGGAVWRGKEMRERRFVLPQKYFVPKPAKKGLHGGGFGGHPRMEEKGMGEAVNGLLRPEVITPRCAEPQRRVRAERFAVERIKVSAAEAASGGGVFCGTAEGVPLSTMVDQRSGFDVALGRQSAEAVPLIRRSKRPWTRMEQAIRATDLLLQAGGFAAVVVDLGGVAPEHVSRIPLATWFRYRAAAERTQASVVLLTQYPCAKSSAGLVLRLHTGEVRAEGGTVLAGLERRVEVVRRRFEHAGNVVPMRKPPQRAGVAEWSSGVAWAGRGEAVRR